MKIDDFYTECVKLQSDSKNCIFTINYYRTSVDISLIVYIYNAKNDSYIRINVNSFTSEKSFIKSLDRIKEIL